MMVEPFKESAVLQNSLCLPVSSSASETPVRVESWATLPARLWCGYLQFPVARMPIKISIPYSMASVLLAYKYRNSLQTHSPCSFAYTIPTIIPQVDSERD